MMIDKPFLQATGQFHVAPVRPDGGAIEFFARFAPAILGTDESFAAAAHRLESGRDGLSLPAFYRSWSLSLRPATK